MKHAMKILVGLVLLGITLLSAQSDLFIPPKPQPLWKADSLFIGASFTRASFDPVKVWFIGNEAGWKGDLYFVDKAGAEKFLFNNQVGNKSEIILSDLYDIPVGDTVYFIYKVTDASSCCNPIAADYLPKYTGANQPGISKYVSQASGKYGNRWSVAGRVNDSVVQFGFEDNTKPSSDFDYDDIIFGTSLSLGQAEIKASLTFTDKAGTPLAPGAAWPPSNDTVYLTYVDDYKNSSLIVDLNLKVINRKGNAAPDAEIFSAVTPLHNGAAGTWKFKIPVKEMPGIPGNKILEVYYKGEVTATVASHTSAGVLDGNILTATLNILYPDQPESVKLNNCSEPGVAITRPTTCISIQVTDQSPTRNLQDTLYANLVCDASSDAITKVQLIEQPDGTFKSANITKNEGTGTATDNILSCSSTDNITVTYVDEIYTKAPITVKAGWTVSGAEAFFFANTNDPTTSITQIKDGAAPNFMVVLQTASPNVATIDTIAITVTSPQGENEKLLAIETGANSGEFRVVVPYSFGVTPPAVDGMVTGYLDPTKVVENVVITATAKSGLKNFTGTITLLPSLNIAAGAYIKDANGDGAGDHVYIIFSRPVAVPPATISPVYWNNTSDFKNDKQPVISILPGFPNIIVADYSANPFPVGKTSVAAGQTPTATLPNDNVFAGQKPVIADSMGPVIILAQVKPFDASTIVKKGESPLGVDTLTFTISEPLRSLTDWQQLVRFTKSNNGVCQDYSTSQPVTPYASVTTIGGNTQFTVLVDNSKGTYPISGDCLFINTDGRYTDLISNKPPAKGTIIVGPKPPRLIQVFRGYPPVVGVTPQNNQAGFAVVNNDPLTVGTESEYTQSFGSQGNQVGWVEPADFPTSYNPSVPYVGVRPSAGVQSPSVGTETKILTPMPPNISTVQVVSTGEYIADISIFDNLGNFIKKFTQSFGYQGELNNINRKAPGGLASYLVWDLKDHRGQKAGQGVYVWKVVFQFKNGKQEIRFTRTGVTRSRTAK